MKQNSSHTPGHAPSLTRHADGMTGTGNGVTRVDQHAAGTVAGEPISTRAYRRPCGNVQHTSGILVATPCDVAGVLELLAVSPVAREPLIAEANCSRRHEEHAACVSVAACCAAQWLAEGAVSREPFLAGAIRDLCDEIGRADGVVVAAGGGAERLAEGPIPPISVLTGAVHTLRGSVCCADGIRVAAAVRTHLQCLAGEAVPGEASVADAGPCLREDVREASGVLVAFGQQGARISQRIAVSPVSCKALQTGAVCHLRIEVRGAAGVRVAVVGRGCSGGTGVWEG